MDKGHLLLWYPHRHKLFPYVIINIENAACFRRGKVTEDHLCGFTLHGTFPYSKSIFHTAVRLAPLRIRQHVV